MRLFDLNANVKPAFSTYWFTENGPEKTSGSEFLARVAVEKKALTDIGLQAGDKVGIRGDNTLLWMVTDVALTELDAVSVVFPAEFNSHAIDDLISTYGLSFFLLSDAGPQTSADRPDVAVMGEIDPARHTARSIDGDPFPVTPDDHSFVFSSGTSGAFKGMVISKKGVLDQIETFCDAIDVSDKDSVLLFMPFSSLQNRTLYYGAMMRNIDIIVVPPAALLEGLKRYRPTILIAPPIFYEAVEKSIRSTLSKLPAVARALLGVASGAAKLLRPVAGGRIANALLRRVYGKAHAAFGGRMRVMVTGMAKIGPSTLEFYRSLGMPLIQVYGLTECGVVCANTLTDNEIGTVGKPLPGTEIAIADDGEIIVRKVAPQTSRFFHFEDSSEDTRFENGSVYTGDLGRLSKSGRLTLVGRKKSTIVGHSGVKVQPEPIEKVLEENMLVSKAVLVPLDEGRRLGVAIQSAGPLSGVQRQSLETLVRATVGTMATSFKDHLRIAVSGEEFTAENGLLTRNLKINRTAVRARFFEPAAAA